MKYMIINFDLKVTAIFYKLEDLKKYLMYDSKGLKNYEIYTVENDQLKELRIKHTVEVLVN